MFAACKKTTPVTTDLAACDATLTYTKDLKALIDLNCASASCHGGNQSPNLTTYAGVINSVNSGRFKKEVITNRSMPQGSSLSAGDFDSFNCWLNAGAPE